MLFFVLLKESPSVSSPVAVLHYGFYNDANDLHIEIAKYKDKIQCIVGKNNVPFGMAQRPRLWDYADGIDTVEFLLKKNELAYRKIKNIILHPSNSNSYGL